MATDLASYLLDDLGGRYPHQYSYLSGSQIAIFLGDILVDEAVFLAYELVQQRRPIYGYASAYWDAVAVGTVLVQGRLAINFVDHRYLATLILDLHLRRTGATSLPPHSHTPEGQVNLLASMAGSNVFTESGRRQLQDAAQVLRSKFWGGGTNTQTLPRPDHLPPVDLIVSYGLASAPQQGRRKKLEQVIFLGETQVIESSGHPLLEVYPFIARRVLNLPN